MANKKDEKGVARKGGSKKPALKPGEGAEVAAKKGAKPAAGKGVKPGGQKPKVYGVQMLAGTYRVGDKDGRPVADVFVEAVDEKRGLYNEHWVHLPYLFGRDETYARRDFIFKRETKEFGGTTAIAKSLSDHSDPQWVYTLASCSPGVLDKKN